MEMFLHAIEWTGLLLLSGETEWPAHSLWKKALCLKQPLHDFVRGGDGHQYCLAVD